MLPISNHVRSIEGVSPRTLTHEILQSTQPIVLKGLVSKWPAVQAGLESASAAMDYLRRFHRDTPVVAMLGAPEIDGRFFYNDDLSGFNFAQMRANLDGVLEKLTSHRDDTKSPAIYVGSTTVDTCLPGFRNENDLDLGDRDALMSIWIGNRTRIAAHYDLPDNIACVAVGHRRFTLFPPEQLGNLYIGPLDLTPAGQSISLVDFAKPDFSRFPKFAEAIKHAQVAELEPGDAIFIPSMWWHHVEALDSFNVLINYWWRESPSYMDSPVTALLLSLMTIRDLPPEQRKAWKNIFNHYIFEADENTAGHIPETARGSLSPFNDDMARGIRAYLLKRLNR